MPTLTCWVGLLALLAASGAAQDGGVAVKPPAAPAGAKPELVPQAVRNGLMSVLSWSPNGRWLAVATGNAIALWDVSARAIWRVLDDHTRDISSLAFAPDGSTLASASRDGSIRLWDVASGRSRRTAMSDSEAALECLAFSPTGRILAAGGEDATVHMWDVDSGQPIGTPLAGHSGGIRSVAFAPDGATVASAGIDGTVRLWDIREGIQLDHWLLESSSPLKWKWVHAVAFSPDGKYLAAGGISDYVYLWNRSSSVLGWPARLPVPQGSVNCLAFSPDSRTLAVGTSSVVLWDTGTGQQRCLAPEESGVTSLAFSPDGRTLAGCYGPRPDLWSVASGERITTLSGKCNYSLLGDLACSPDGQMLGALDAVRRTVRRWTLATGQPHGAPIELRHGAVQAAFSPDWSSVAVAGDVLERHDMTTGRELLEVDGGMADRVALAPDGRTVAISRTTDVKLLGREADPPGGTTLGEHDMVVTCLAFSPNGAILASGSYDGTVRLWDVAAGRQRGAPLRTQPMTEVRAVSFSPDGLTVAAGCSDNTARLWDVASGLPRGNSLQGHTGPVTSVAFSSDGMTLASASVDKTVRQWDVATGQPCGHPLVGHTSPIASVVYVPRGRSLASSGEDNAIRVWDPQTGRCLAALYGLDGAGYLVVTPQGYYDCSVDAPNAVVWRIGDRVYPFDQFAEKFNRPDLVRRALAGEDISNAPALDATQLPPNLAIVSPVYGAEVDGDSVEVELQAAGQRPIRRVELTVNGAPLAGDAARTLEVATPDQTTRTFRLTVPLPPNEPRVRLRAVAYDTESLKSRVEELALFRPGVKQAVGALHVLAVGINRYPQLPADYQLRYAVPDAQAVAEALGRQGGGQPYTEVKTKLLLDDQATVTNLKFALRELKDAATENDVAVLFVSGHGVADPAGNFYFPTCEVDLDDIPHTALSWQDFVGALREVRAKRVLVLADTCHSGAVAGNGKSADEQLALKLNKEAHRLVFAASGRDEVSVGRAEWGHGAFTTALLEALAGKAEADRDGQLTLQELRDYLPARVAALTEDRQHPQLPFLDSFEPEAVLAQVP